MKIESSYRNMNFKASIMILGAKVKEQFIDELGVGFDEIQAAGGVLGNGLSRGGRRKIGAAGKNIGMMVRPRWWQRRVDFRF